MQPTWCFEGICHFQGYVSEYQRYMNISLSQYEKKIERLRAVLTLLNDVAIFDKESPSRTI
jgi:hypothetical protein